MKEGTIVTFYSYKGGVGRTLALANVGALLSRWGFKVLCVDLDLEAPGFKAYFQKWLDQPLNKGLVDLIYDYTQGHNPDWRNYLIEVKLPETKESLQLLFSGNAGDSYVAKVQELNWAELYDKHDLGDFIEELRDSWKAFFDFILIDSRTGITDIGGICTVQLPDILVVLTSATEQGIQGSADVIRRAKRTRNNIPYDRAKLLVLPVATRFELRVEYETTEKWLDYFIYTFEEYYKEWSHRDIKITELVNFTRVPYIPYWNFGERLPVIEKGTEDSEDIGYAFESLASLIAQKLSDTDILVRSRDEYISRLDTSRSKYQFDFFISYSIKDRQWAEWIAWQLETAGFTTTTQVWDGMAGGNFVEDMVRVVRQARQTIALLSRDYFRSGFTASEWHVAFERDLAGKFRKFIPVRVRECDVEGLLDLRMYIDLVGKDESEAKDELLRHIRAIVESKRLKPDPEPNFPPPTQLTTSESGGPQFPGALPGVWNIPLRRNHYFTGHDDLIAEIEKALAAGGTDELPKPQAITGLGGVGKTQLAVEYAYRYAGTYDIVWWVRSEEPVTMATDFARLGPELNPPITLAADLDRNIAAVRRRLEQTDRWLIVFDNAPDAGSVSKLLPQSATGHILVTSRNQSWRGVARPLSVRTLARDDAIKFLLERTAQSDHATANDLAEELGDLPLALEQAAAYIETTGKPMTDYLRLFRAKQQEMIRRGQPATDYEASVATTWEISFQSLRERAPTAADLLNLFAFFSPEAIRREWIVAGAEYLPETLAEAVNDELALDDIAAAFRRYSLVEVGAEHKAFTVHRLVQTVTRARMSRKERHHWVGAAVCIVNEIFPGDDFYQRPETWPLCNELLAHARALTEHAESLGVAKEQTARLLNQVGLFLNYVLAKFAEAKESYERALKIDEAVFGSDHPNVARDLNNLALVLKDLGNLAQARTLFEHALRVDEAAFGSDHPNVARDLNHLALVLKDLGNFAQARTLFERALSIFRKFLGEDHPYTRTVLGNLESLVKKMNGE